MVGAASQICRFQRIPSFRHAAPDDAYIPICPPRAGRVYLWAGHQSGIPGMLAKARSIQRWTWLGSKPEDQLLKQFSEVSGNNPSPYVKIAAMHAVLRALGADFRNIGRFSDGMFDQVSKKGGTIQYNYALPVPRIGALSRWPGDAWFIGGLKYEKWSNSSRCTFAQGHQEAKDSSIRRLWSTVARWRSATAL